MVGAWRQGAQWQEQTETRVLVRMQCFENGVEASVGVVTHYFNPSRRETRDCLKKKCVYKCVMFISEEHSAVLLANADWRSKTLEQSIALWGFGSLVNFRAFESVFYFRIPRLRHRKPEVGFSTAEKGRVIA